MTTTFPEPLITEGEAARILRVSIVSLRRWRRQGSGPVYRKLGRTVRYRPNDLSDFVASAGRISTSSPGSSENGMMQDLMLYPVWQRLPRPRFFPQDPRLDRLLTCNYDRGFDGFQLALRRREARDLRKGLFGPKGSRVVPMLSSKREEYDGLMEFDLPNGWRLRLAYEPPPSRRRAGRVEAEFKPPRARRSRCRSQEGISLAA